MFAVFQKPSTVAKGALQMKAVEEPDPGESYNPDYESHQVKLFI